MATETSFTYSPSQPQTNFQVDGIYMDLPLKVVCGNTTPAGSTDELNETWNCNLCPGDTQYSIPVTLDKPFYLQTQFIDLWGAVAAGHDWNDGSSGDWFVDAQIVDENGGVIESDITTFTTERMAGNAKGISYQNLLIGIGDMGLSVGDCFHIKLIHKLVSGAGATEVFFSERYEIIDPACQNLVELEGTYRGFDCVRNWYGEAENFAGTSNLKYRNIRQFRGMLEYSSTDEDREINDADVVTSLKINDIWDLKLWQLPPFEIEILKPILTAPTITGDGVEFTESKGISKANETGRMWLVSTELKKVCGDGEVDLNNCE